MESSSQQTGKLCKAYVKCSTPGVFVFVCDHFWDRSYCVGMQCLQVYADNIKLFYSTKCVWFWLVKSSSSCTNCLKLKIVYIDVTIFCCTVCRACVDKVVICWLHFLTTLWHKKMQSWAPNIICVATENCNFPSS